jgi:PAS domain S-box-containing protein
MRYRLADLLDIPRLQALLDSLDEIYSIPSAIIDTEGNILTATAWQDICVKFHRSNPDTEKICIKSDTHVAGELSRGETQVIYKCPQGLVDTATPIVVDGKHIGNAFTGQLLLEPPDEDLFRKQARRYGFDEEDYIAALRKVPVVPEEKLKQNLKVLSGLTVMLAEQGLQHKRQLELEAETKGRETRYRTLFEQSPHAVLILDLETTLPVEFNGNLVSLLGYTPEELHKLKPSDYEAVESPEKTKRHIEKILQEGGDEFETRYRCKDGSVKDVHVNARVIELGGKRYLHNILQDITEKKQTAEALRQSRETFRALVEFTDSIHWEFDIASNGFTYVSPQIEKILGFPPDSWDTLESWAESLHPDDREWAVSYCHAKTASREDHEFVYRAIAADGRVVWLRDVVKVIADGENPVKLIGIMFDITSQKTSEQELSYSENYLKSIIENEPGCVKLVEADGTLVDINPSGLRMIDADGIEQVRGKKIYGIIAPEYRDDFKSLTERVCRGERGALLFEIISLKGTRRWLETHSVPFHDEKNNRTLLLGVTLDITKRKQAEDALLEKSLDLAGSEKKYRNLFSSIRDVIIVADNERNIIDANQPALREQFGYEIHEILGRQTSVLYASDAGFKQTGREVFDERDAPIAKLLEVTLRKKDGSTFPAELFALKLVNDAGGIAGNIGVIRDITERKIAEQNIIASLREKELLLREVHHRVKNNMAVISSLLALQSEYIDDEKYLEIFKESQSRISSMALVHEKLYQKEDFVSIDVKEYIKSLVEGIDGTFAGDSSIHLVTDVEPAQMDIDTLIPCGLIINELLTNSYKHAFADIDNPQIVLRLTRTSDKDIGLTISDNGKGLPEGFDISRDSGLGLKLVRTLVNQLNGELELRSGKGATFSITFPRNLEFSWRGPAR